MNLFKCQKRDGRDHETVKYLSHFVYLKKLSVFVDNSTKTVYI
jgi:hypothetical protein